MQKKLCALALLLGLLLGLTACGTRLDKTSELLKYKDTEKIQALDAAVAEFYESQGLQGISVGVLVDGHVRFFSHGATQADGSPITEDTRFDLGSLTQVFTGVTYGESIYRRYLSDGSTLEKMFPYLSLPDWEGEGITYGQLATHRSGLEDRPANLPREDTPYAFYSELDLRRYLSTTILDNRPGTVCNPDGMDMGLLGFALEVARKTPYEQHVKNVIMYSIGMTRTTVTFEEDDDSHLATWATPHDSGGNPLPHQEYASLQGMAGFKSTAYDMVLFAWCNMNMPGTEETFAKAEAAGWSREDQLYRSSYKADGTVDTDAQAVIGEMLKGQSVMERLYAGMMIAQDEHYADGSVSLGYGFIRDELDGSAYFWQSGGDAGNSAFLGFVPQTASAVVVLANTAGDTQALGEQLLAILHG